MSESKATLKVDPIRKSKTSTPISPANNDTPPTDPDPRRQLTWLDFATESIAPDRLQEILRLFPKLLHRNFYVLQRHWATSPHCELM